MRCRVNRSDARAMSFRHAMAERQEASSEIDRSDRYVLSDLLKSSGPCGEADDLRAPLNCCDRSHETSPLTGDNLLDDETIGPISAGIAVLSSKAFRRRDRSAVRQRSIGDIGETTTAAAAVLIRPTI